MAIRLALASFDAVVMAPASYARFEASLSGMVLAAAGILFQRSMQLLLKGNQSDHLGHDLKVFLHCIASLHGGVERPWQRRSNEYNFVLG